MEGGGGGGGGWQHPGVHAGAQAAGHSTPHGVGLRLWTSIKNWRVLISLLWNSRLLIAITAYWCKLASSLISPRFLFYYFLSLSLSLHITKIIHWITENFPISEEPIETHFQKTHEIIKTHFQIIYPLIWKINTINAKIYFQKYKSIKKPSDVPLTYLENVLIIFLVLSALLYC